MGRLNKNIGDLRERVERGFGQWALIVMRLRWLILIASLAFVAALSPHLSDLKIESSVDSVLTEDDPYLITLDKFRLEFGNDERILLLIDSGKENGVFDIGFLRKLEALHHQIEAEVGQIENVDSLVNARDMLGRNDELIVGELLEEFPGTAQQLAAIKQRVEQIPLVRSTYLNDDMSATVIVIKTDTYTSLDEHGKPIELDLQTGFSDADANTDTSKHRQAYLSATETKKIVTALKNIVAEYSQDDFFIIVGGTPVLVEQISEQLMKNVISFSTLSLILIIALLGIIFRRLDICFVPPFVAVLTMVTTVSFMTILDIPISLTVQMVPTLILAISVANSVHLFTSFFQAIHRGEDKKTALQSSMQHSALAIFMTGLTTAGGLLSFAFADVRPVIEFGIIAPIGVISALAFTLIFLPAVMAIIPIKPVVVRDSTQNPAQRLMRWCTEFSTSKPFWVVSIWAIFTIAAVVLMRGVTVTHDMPGWLPEDDPVRKQIEYLNEGFGGANFLEVQIDTHQENGLHNPQILNRMQALDDYARTLGNEELFIGNSVSLVDISKELHKALNNNDAAFYRIPQAQDIITQELFLFELTGNDDLEELVDSQFSKARMTMTVPLIGNEKYSGLLHAIDAKSKELFAGMADVTLTGLMTIMAVTVEALISSLVKSYFIALIVITPIMMALLGSVRIGLLSMIPNVVPIMITLGLMGLLGISLDLLTLLTGSIALGLAVDDTIHFMHNYQRFYYRYNDSKRAVGETLQTTGTALTFTSIILAGGFLVYTSSSMSTLTMFGALTCFCIVVAFLADILLAPALMTLLTMYRQRRAKNNG